MQKKVKKMRADLNRFAVTAKLHTHQSWSSWKAVAALRFLGRHASHQKGRGKIRRDEVGESQPPGRDKNTTRCEREKQKAKLGKT